MSFITQHGVFSCCWVSFGLFFSILETGNRLLICINCFVNLLLVVVIVVVDEDDDDDKMMKYQ